MMSKFPDINFSLVQPEQRLGKAEGLHKTNNKIFFLYKKSFPTRYSEENSAVSP